MSRTRLAGLLSIALVLAGVTCAEAVDRDYGRSGPYLGAGGIYAFEDFTGQASNANADDSWGYFLEGGYRFNPWFALELNWQHYLGFNEGGGGGGDTNIWMIGVDAKFYPFHGIVQPYALAGAGFTNVDPSASTGESSASGAGFRFGGGLDVYITRNWAATADVGYYLPTGPNSNFGAIPINFGVIYRFY